MSDNEKKSSNQNGEDSKLFEKLFQEEMMEIDEDTLSRSARGLFALYSSFIKAGFPEERAFALVTTIILTSLGGSIRPRSDN